MLIWCTNSKICRQTASNAHMFATSRRIGTFHGHRKREIEGACTIAPRILSMRWIRWHQWLFGLQLAHRCLSAYLVCVEHVRLDLEPKSSKIEMNRRENWTLNKQISAFRELARDAYRVSLFTFQQISTGSTKCWHDPIRAKVLVGVLWCVNAVPVLLLELRWH